MKTRPRRVLRAGLGWSSLVLLLVGSFIALVLAPPDAVQGNVQRIMYVHVPAAWVGFLAFFVVFVGSVMYLVRSTPGWDHLAAASAEIGVLFTAQAIVAGAIWGKPTWGTWWTWDPRLTTATVMELIYLAYLMLRQGIEDPDRRARFGAVYAIVGFLSVPLTFFSARLFRTIHPVVIGTNDPNAQGQFDMTPAMTQAFMFSLLTFTFIFADLLWHRIRLGRLADKVEQLRLKVIQ
jgi:heme exporter protein C